MVKKNSAYLFFSSLWLSQPLCGLLAIKMPVHLWLEHTLNGLHWIAWYLYGGFFYSKFLLFYLYHNILYFYHHNQFWSYVYMFHPNHKTTIHDSLTFGDIQTSYIIIINSDSIVYMFHPSLWDHHAWPSGLGIFCELEDIQVSTVYFFLSPSKYIHRQWKQETKSFDHYSFVKYYY